MFRRIISLAAVALTISAVPAHAQFGKLKDKVKAKVSEKTEKKVDCLLGEIFKDGKCVKDTKAADDKKVSKDSDDDEKASGGDGTAASLAKVNTMRPGQGAWANFDFMPGNRPLFVDDLTRDRVGNFPKRMELDGGTYEIVEWEGKRWLSATSEGNFHVILPEALPERWTMEFDITVPWWGMYVYPGKVAEGLPNDHLTQMIYLGVSGQVSNGAKGNKTEFDPRNLFGRFFFSTCIENCNEADIERNHATWKDNGLSQPMRVRVQADGAYMKVYLNEKRVANMPNMGRWQGNQLNFYFRDHNADEGTPLIGNFSINAGGRELYDALMADGRLAVQGIYFDTGKDRIRPESSGTLAEISAVMSEHPELKLTIEGHTDNVGDAVANQKLSEARAAAVVAALTAAPYKVGADRFKSVGLGPSKPARPNDTPEGRQANRRVELVVQK
ncbi:MAG TPA: OmpA family protein [Longimicrobiales bacterium]|nr:OmpA family protein [Longimicrobiales bacterium]